MGTALVAYVDRSSHRIELDPAVRIGARLDGQGETLLLHTTSAGHCEETATHLAKLLRRSGWEVQVRHLDVLGPLRPNVSGGPGMLPHAVAVELISQIGHADPNQQPAAVPPPRGLSETARRQHSGYTRQRCRICGHKTAGRGVISHRTNIGHDDWEKVFVAQDGTVTPTGKQAGAPEASGEPSSASDSRVHGYT